MKTKPRISIGPQSLIQSTPNALLVIPFGKFRSVTETQKFSRMEADGIREEFYKMRGSASGLAGIPIYAGFPLVPGRPETNPSAPALGWVADLTAAERGLFITVKWGEPGRASMQDNEFRFFAPVWLVQESAGVDSPFKIIALGLTNQFAGVQGNMQGENDAGRPVVNPSAARASAVAKEMGKMSDTLSQATRYQTAWNIAAKKSPGLFRS